MVRLLKSGSFAVAVSLFLALPIWTSGVSAESPPPAEHFIEGETEKGIPFMSGGFGAEERAMMERQDEAYNLQIAFAEKSGAYLADVEVSIEDRNGDKIVDATSPGPLFYVQLPRGSYSLASTFEGQTRRIDDIRVSESGQTSRILHWDLPSEPGPVVAGDVASPEIR